MITLLKPKPTVTKANLRLIPGGKYPVSTLSAQEERVLRRAWKRQADTYWAARRGRDDEGA